MSWARPAACTACRNGWAAEADPTTTTWTSSVPLESRDGITMMAAIAAIVTARKSQ